MYHEFFIPSSVMGMGCFHYLVTVNAATRNTECRFLFDLLILLPFNLYSLVGLLDHIVVQDLRNPRKVFYIIYCNLNFTNRVQGFLFFHILDSNDYISSFRYSHPFWQKMISTAFLMYVILIKFHVHGVCLLLKMSATFINQFLIQLCVCLCVHVFY
jgi:hypothetical protein